MQQKLVIAISSRALFNLDKSHEIYQTQGLAAYADYQIQHENETLQPGFAFNFVKKLLNLRDPNSQQPFVEVILLSRNSADTGLRIFNSIKHYKLDITRAAFTNGEKPYSYVSAFSADLFLSSHSEDVKQAIDSGIAAAILLSPPASQDNTETLNIAFDGDSVLFSDEAEKIYQTKGLAAFSEHEADKAHTPLPGGPFKPFLQALHQIQQCYPENACPLRTALITARSAPAHERVIRTLRAWEIRIDEALFLGGLAKGEFLKAFGADVFFDDHPVHCESAREHVATGHVPSGVVNNS